MCHVGYFSRIRVHEHPDESFGQWGEHCLNTHTRSEKVILRTLTLLMTFPLTTSVSLDRLTEYTGLDTSLFTFGLR